MKHRMMMMALNTFPNRMSPAVLVLGAWSVVLSAGEPPLKLGKEHTNAIGMKLVRIDPGEFIMGAGEAPPKTDKEWLARDWDEAPAHKVLPAAAALTEVGKLASAMKPGEWREIQSKGYDFTTLMRGQDILAYSGRAAWDERSQQALFIGQTHLKGPPVFITYSAKENAWKRMPTPKWAESLKWFHAYENNTADSARGVFFHHSSASTLVHKYDVAKDAWTTLPDLKAPTGHGTALEYFPEMKGLVRVYGGGVWFWSEEKNAWSHHAGKLDMGPYHNFAAYSPKFKMVLLGGGNGSKAIHRLDADGKITAAKASPVYLGIGLSLNVVDPVSGELLVLSKDKKFLAYHPGKDEWRELPATDGPTAKYGGHSVSAVPLTNHGVVLFFSSRPQGMKTFLYKHADK